MGYGVNVGLLIILGLIVIYMGATVVHVWREHHKPLPMFCTECGCPLLTSWVNEKTTYNQYDGLGIRTERQVLHCRKAKVTDVDRYDGWPHTVIELNATREIPVGSECP